MANKNEQLENMDNLSLEDLEISLNDQLENTFSGMEVLKEQHESIGNPSKLGEVVLNTVWEQFRNNVASVAGEDFITDNGNMTLDLRNEAHIQTTENFAEGKIATHNKKIDYQQRHDDWQSNFQKDDQGNTVYHSYRTGIPKETLVQGARKPYDKDRPSCSQANKTDMDHTVSAGELIRDAGANAHLSGEERITFANSQANLNEMNSSHNKSKSDLSMAEWLENSNANGQKPKDIFDLDDETSKKYYEKDKEAREELERVKKEGEQKSIEAGKKSRKEEAFRIGGKALRAVITQLIGEFIKEVVRKFIKWLRSAGKTIKSLLSHLEEAIHDFVSNIGRYVLSSGQTLLTTIATAIFGPVVRTVTKVFNMLKQGLKSLGEVIKYIRDPENKNQPVSVLVAEIGKIVVVGMSAAGALLLSDVVEKDLMAIPPLAIEIPILGSLASFLGLAISGLLSGLLGAIVINFIDRFITKSQKAELTKKMIEKKNNALAIQHVQNYIATEQVIQTQNSVFHDMQANHDEANKVMRDILEDMDADVSADNASVVSENKDALDKMHDELSKLL